MGDNRIHIILLAFVVTLALSFGGGRLYYQMRVADPLLQEIQGQPGVAEAMVVSSGKTKDIVVIPETGADLIEVYNNVEKLGQTRLGSSFREVKIQDNRSAELSEVLYRIHFHVYEGIATGMFTTMKEEIDTVVAGESLTDYKVVVTLGRVFIHLENGEHMLFEVIPRPMIVAGAPAAVATASAKAAAVAPAATPSASSAATPAKVVRLW
ncbi:MAG TPA: hypothetical protein GXX29_10255 [Firmicutes bacterium]|nr:hypothetical protein [Bacillota bacterium]